MSTNNPNPAPAETDTKSFPGFTDEEIRDFDFTFRKDFKIDYRRNEDGEDSYAVTSKKGIKQLRTFMWWKKRRLPAHEMDGWKYSDQMYDYITSKDGRFLRDELGEYHILIAGRRIPIDVSSNEMKTFLLDTCKITSLSREAEVAVERLKIAAHKSSSKMTFRRFSAMYDGESPRVYLPVTEPGKILVVTSKDIALVSNGDNEDQLWLEHPEHNPIEWGGAPTMEAVRAALVEFERLLVDTQACAVPSMRWFVAMAEGLFPIVRDVASNRFIMLHIGDKGHGKTTGAKSFVLLHGFQDVLLDVTVAALGNSPEQGLIVVDNKEQQNFPQSLIDYFLSVATGGARIRSDSSRSVHRDAPKPVGVITSIEGVRKAELHDRCVEVRYFLADGQERLDRDQLERDIVAARNRIMAAIPVVIREYLTVRVDPNVHIGVRPIDRFNRHFRELCCLLIAYGRVMQRDGDGDKWAMEHIHAWDAEIRSSRTGDSDDGALVSPLEDPILYFIKECQEKQIEFEYPRDSGRRGTLHIVSPSALLGTLQRQRIPGLVLPAEPAAFGRRLRNETFERFKLLGHDHGVPRNNAGQRVGVFVPNGEPGSGGS